jgi:hypothetical protein
MNNNNGLIEYKESFISKIKFFQKNFRKSEEQDNVTLNDLSELDNYNKKI